MRSPFCGIAMPCIFMQKGSSCYNNPYINFIPSLDTSLISTLRKYEVFSLITASAVSTATIPIYLYFIIRAAALRTTLVSCSVIKYFHFHRNLGRSTAATPPMVLIFILLQVSIGGGMAATPPNYPRSHCTCFSKNR